jgi:NADP-dependent 3-hydroxy acid dehydrogenase YdfG
MPNAIIVAGYGPGISHAMARRFGREGYKVALVGRDVERGASGVATLAEEGVAARSYRCDLGDQAAARAMVQQVQADIGPVEVLHWNPYSAAAGDLTTASPDALHATFDVAVTGLMTSVQAALADLERTSGAVLVTSGSFATDDPRINEMAARIDYMGFAVSKAAQYKAVNVLHHRLAPAGIFVGQVVVLGTVQRSAADRGDATIDPDAVAERFWRLSRERDAVSVPFSG